MKQLIFTFVIILFAMSCENSDDINPLLSINTEITTDYLVAGDLDVFEENLQIVRHKGKPGVEVIQIGNENLADFEDCFVLYIASGAESEGNVSSAIISLDGVVLLNASNFTGEYLLYTFEVCHLTADSYLEVEIRGEPGSYLDIWIEGKIKDPFAGDEGTFIDERDNQEYKWVRIGEQIWMAENLQTAYLVGGAEIPLVVGNSEWGNLSTPGYCWFNNNVANRTSYGALYNWYAVNTGELAPTGWHVPSDGEWTQLTDFLGGEEIAGGKLKEAGTIHWQSPNTAATNETGFTGRPGGSRTTDGSFLSIGWQGEWWSSTVNGDNFAYYRFLKENKGSVTRSNFWKEQGYSVRCIKD